MLQKNNVSEDSFDEVIIEKSVTDDGRKKEKHIKEEKIGEETHKIVEVFEEMPLKLKTKVIEKTKNFNLVYEKEIITYNSETGEVLNSVVEKLDLPELRVVQQNKEVYKEIIKDNNIEVKSIIKKLEEKVTTNDKSKKILDKVLLGVVVAQLCYLVYYFFR